MPSYFFIFSSYFLSKSDLLVGDGGGVYSFSSFWATNKNDEREVKVMQNLMERSMMEIRLRDRISINTIRKKMIKLCRMECDRRADFEDLG